jgi:phenylalanine-4-hydroxylase
MPLLVNPVFADLMVAYGNGGQRAMQLGRLANLARLYWYTVEFGLIRTTGADLLEYGRLSPKAPLLSKAYRRTASLLMFSV